MKKNTNMAPVQKVDKGIVRNVRLQVYQYGGLLLSIKKKKKKKKKKNLKNEKILNIIQKRNPQKYHGS